MVNLWRAGTEHGCFMPSPHTLPSASLPSAVPEVYPFIMGFPGNSASKESGCNEGDPSSIPGSGRSLGEGIGYSWAPVFMDFPGGTDGKESACNAGDPDSIAGSGRSPGEGNGNPCQYCCLENPMDRGAWWTTVHAVAKSRTRLSNFALTFKDSLKIVNSERHL